jgi:hypothetical protein
MPLTLIYGLGKVGFRYGRFDIGGCISGGVTPIEHPTVSLGLATA